jgi:hypothetical protein
MNNGREFSEERGKSYPTIDESIDYEIKNITFSPVALTLCNSEKTSMETLILGGRKSMVIPGSRLTNYVFEFQDRKLVKVKPVT